MSAARLLVIVATLATVCVCVGGGEGCNGTHTHTHIERETHTDTQTHRHTNTLFTFDGASSPAVLGSCLRRVSSTLLRSCGTLSLARLSPMYSALLKRRRSKGSKRCERGWGGRGVHSEYSVPFLVWPASHASSNPRNFSHSLSYFVSVPLCFLVCIFRHRCAAHTSCTTHQPRSSGTSRRKGSSIALHRRFR